MGHRILRGVTPAGDEHGIAEGAAEQMDMMTRSITIVKSVHTLIFLLLSGLLVVFLYEVIVDRITALTWIAVALLLVEGIVLIANGWKCPLTTYAENLGAARGQVTDIFLPKWIADRVFEIYGGLFAVGLLLLVVRILL